MEGREEKGYFGREREGGWRDEEVRGGRCEGKKKGIAGVYVARSESLIHFWVALVAA